MKVILGYDGTAGADIAKENLLLAGLPPAVELRVASVADIWSELVALQSSYDDLYPHAMATARRLASNAMDESQAQAEKAAQWLRKHFPHAKVDISVVADSPGHGLVRQSQEWRADLVVVGSHGRSILGRLFLGSVSHQVLNDLNCSVRVARRSNSNPGEPLRLILGVDGSACAGAAVSCVAQRTWPKGTSIRVVVAVEEPVSLLMPPVEGFGGHWLVAHGTDLKELGLHAAKSAATHLAEAGLSAVPILRQGSPKKVLIDEADEWGANCIFVGAQGLRGIDRLLLGSVSMAMSTRAQCSVEVVRQGQK
jgi:nucleotide-binding universal stress UspA family protein